MPHWSLKGRDIGSGCSVVLRALDVEGEPTVVVLATVGLTPINSSSKVFSARSVADFIMFSSIRADRLVASVD